MGPFDALCDCDDHIKQCSSTDADSNDSNPGVGGPKVGRLHRRLAIVASRPTSLCVFFLALHEEVIALMLHCLSFC